MKRCPSCTENIQDKAIYCRFCKNDLSSLESKEKELFISGNYPTVIYRKSLPR
jgi:hypothetical protein